MQGGHTCVAAGEKKSDPEEKKKKERNNRRSRTDRCYIQLLLSHFLDALGDIFVSYQRWLKKTKHDLPLAHSDSNLEKNILYLRESKVMRKAMKIIEWGRVAAKARELRPCECLQSEKCGSCNEMV